MEERDPQFQITHSLSKKETHTNTNLCTCTLDSRSEPEEWIHLCVGGLPKPPKRRGPFPVSGTSLGRRWKTMPSDQGFLSGRKKEQKINTNIPQVLHIRNAGVTRILEYLPAVAQRGKSIWLFVLRWLTLFRLIVVRWSWS